MPVSDGTVPPRKIKMLFPEEGRKAEEWTKTADVYLLRYSVLLQATDKESKVIREIKEALIFSLSHLSQLPSSLTF